MQLGDGTLKKILVLAITVIFLLTAGGGLNIFNVDSAYAKSGRGKEGDDRSETDRSDRGDNNDERRRREDGGGRDEDSGHGRGHSGGGDIGDVAEHKLDLDDDKEYGSSDGDNKKKDDQAGSDGQNNQSAQFRPDNYERF